MYTQSATLRASPRTAPRAIRYSAHGLLLWIVGLQLHHAYAAAIACHPAGFADWTLAAFAIGALAGILIAVTVWLARRRFV